MDCIPESGEEHKAETKMEETEEANKENICPENEEPPPAQPVETLQMCQEIMQSELQACLSVLVMELQDPKFLTMHPETAKAKIPANAIDNRSIAALYSFMEVGGLFAATAAALYRREDVEQIYQGKKDGYETGEMLFQSLRAFQSMIDVLQPAMHWTMLRSNPKSAEIRWLPSLNIFQTVLLCTMHNWEKHSHDAHPRAKKLLDVVQKVAELEEEKKRSGEQSGKKV